MYSLTAGLQQLVRQLDGEFPAAPGLQVLSVSLTYTTPDQQLSWLASQAQWPQFFWQQRDDKEALAALGSVMSFTSLSEGQSFLQTPPARELALKICGLNAFDPARGALFLPRLLWQVIDNQVSLHLTLHSHHSLAEDAAEAMAFIKNLAEPQSLAWQPQELSRQQHIPDAGRWQQLIGQALNAIDNGELDKVVLARASDLYFPEPVHAASFLAASQRVNLRCYHFYMGFNESEAFIGSSPERLWRRRGLELRTEALAGTVANSPDDAEASRLGLWLMQDDKNQRENMLVVEDIRQRLTRTVNSLDILPPQVVRLRKVQHLRRCIWSTLNGADDYQCLNLLQPTAAVAGLPRQAALAFIAQNEPFTREWYAGSAGYLSLKNSEFCVALRSAAINENRVRLYAGAGIVTGSDPVLEWQEIENKAAGLRTLLCKGTE